MVHTVTRKLSFPVAHVRFKESSCKMNCQSVLAFRHPVRHVNDTQQWLLYAYAYYMPLLTKGAV